MNRAQIHRKKMLEHLGRNLQNHMSTAYVDIRRQNSVTGTVEEVYSNIVCNVSRKNIDAPDIGSNTAPVIVNFTVHFPVCADVRNSDTLTVKLPDESGREILSAFRGVAGNPYISQSRLRMNLQMNQLGFDDIRNEVTPLPQPDIPPDPETHSKITVRFIAENGDPLRDEKIFYAPKDESLEVEALVFHGFTLDRSYFNGEEFTLDKFTFTPELPEYEIEFVYSEVTVPLYLKQFVNSRFRRDNGQLVTVAPLGHWYQSIPIQWQGDMTLISPVNQLVHMETRAVIRLQAGSRVLLMPQETVAEVVSVAPAQDGFSVVLREAEPTEVERNAYITNWYGTWQP